MSQLSTLTWSHGSRENCGRSVRRAMRAFRCRRACTSRPGARDVHLPLDLIGNSVHSTANFSMLLWVQGVQVLYRDSCQSITTQGTHWLPSAPKRSGSRESWLIHAPDLQPVRPHRGQGRLERRNSPAWCWVGVTGCGNCGAAQRDALISQQLAASRQ